MQIDHLSASSIRTYMECGLLFKLSKIDRLETIFSGDSLVFGTAMHQVLADCQTARMQGQTMLIDEMLDRFEEIWSRIEQNDKPIQYHDGNDHQSLLEEGKALLRLYHDGLLENPFQTIAVEQRFEFLVDGIDIPIIGYIDLIEEDQSGTIIITDYKTSGRAYSNDEVNRNLQLTLYHMAMKANGYRHRNLLLKIDCLIKTKKPRFEQYFTSRNTDDENRLVKIMASVYDGIRKNVFVPNTDSWRCKDCSYALHCLNWFTQENRT